MTLIQKSDVKEDPSLPSCNGIHLLWPASHPDATGFSGDRSERADSNESNRVEGCKMEHPRPDTMTVRPKVDLILTASR
jgi:hypothetical protein